jgi:hypothetical protein
MIETLVYSAVLGLTNVLPPASLPTRPGTLPVAAMATDPKHPVIVHIVSRDQTVTVKAGEQGLLYSLTGSDGKVLVADATAEKFAELQPALYRNIRTFIAAKTDDSPVAPVMATVAGD